MANCQRKKTFAKNLEKRCSKNETLFFLSRPCKKVRIFCTIFSQKKKRIDRVRKPKQRLIVGEKKDGKRGHLSGERSVSRKKESLDDVSRQEEKRFLVPKMWNLRRYFHFLLEERGGALNSISRPFHIRGHFFPFCAKTKPSLSLFLLLQYFSPIGHGSGAAEEEQKRVFLPPESKFHLHPTRFSPSLHSLVGGPPRLLGKYRLSKNIPK